MWLPYLKLSDLLPETHLFFIWPRYQIFKFNAQNCVYLELCNSISIDSYGTTVFKIFIWEGISSDIGSGI